MKFLNILQSSLFKPTEITVAANGDFYVADGYGLDFIIQYDHNGETTFVILEVAEITTINLNVAMA